MAPSWLRKAHWLTISLIAAFALLQIGLSLPEIATEAVGGVGVCPPNEINTNEACKQARSEGQIWVAFNQGIKAFSGLVMGPSVGAISDVYGRRFFLVGAFSLKCAGQWLLCATMFGYFNFKLWAVVDGFGGLMPFLPALLAVIADECPPARRAAYFSLLLASFQLPLLLVPIFAAKLSLTANVLLACICSSLSLALAIAYGETLPAARRLRVPDWSDKFWAPHKAVGILNSAPIFRRLSIVILSNGLIGSGIQSFFLLFVESAFHVGRPEATSYLSILALAGLFAQIFLMPVLTRKLGLSRTMVVGLSLQMLQHILLLIDSKPILVVSCVFGGVSQLVFPCVSALKANAAPEDQQGRIQGAITSLQSFTMGLGPLLFGAFFSFLERPGSPFSIRVLFLVTLALILPALLVSINLHRIVPVDHSIPLRHVSTSVGQRGGQDKQSFSSDQLVEDDKDAVGG